MTASLTIRVLQGFEDCTPAQWNALLDRSSTREVFLTWQWLSAWWQCFEREKLLLIVIERDQQTVAIAPLFADGGMIYFVGSGGSDFLDFIGDVSEPEILDGILESARSLVPDFCGFLFYHVLDSSPTGRLLKNAADRRGFNFVEDGSLVAPFLQLRGSQPPEQANKTSLRRHEGFFRRHGKLQIEDLLTSQEILRHLEGFMLQHVARWAGTPYPSLFVDASQRSFYARLTEIAAETSLVRFTRVLWDSRPIAYHYGFCYGGSYLWYKPAFDLALAKHSPGEVLLRHLLIAAAGEGVSRFDFGLGDEPFKSRFASGERTVRNFGLYPRETSA